MKWFGQTNAFPGSHYHIFRHINAGFSSIICKSLAKMAEPLIYSVCIEVILYYTFPTLSTMRLQHFSVPMQLHVLPRMGGVVVSINSLCATAMGLHQKHIVSRLDSLINKYFGGRRWAYKFERSVTASDSYCNLMFLVYFYCLIC